MVKTFKKFDLVLVKIKFNKTLELNVAIQIDLLIMIPTAANIGKMW